MVAGPAFAADCRSFAELAVVDGAAGVSEALSLVPVRPKAVSAAGADELSASPVVESETVGSGSRDALVSPGVEGVAFCAEFAAGRGGLAFSAVLNEALFDTLVGVRVEDCVSIVAKDALAILVAPLAIQNVALIFIAYFLILLI